MSSHDKLYLFLIETQLTRDADRYEFDYHLHLLHLRNFGKLHRGKMKTK